MSLKLVFLGRLEGAAGAGERQVKAVASLAEVFALLEPELAKALRAEGVKIAVNGVLFNDREAPVLKDGDELAFLPPVSGG